MTQEVTLDNNNDNNDALRYIDQFKLIRLIGEGGFGEVFEALQTHPIRRRVALKLLRRELATREVIALRAGQHEAVAGQLVCWDAKGDGIELKAGASGARFTLFSGSPLRQRRVMRGLFVASSEAQLARFGSDFTAGRFGTLSPLSAG